MSEKRMVYAEDVIQRICSMAPEILGGEYNPDIEDEVEQLVCVVESTPTVAPAVEPRPIAKWLVVRRTADGAECKCGNCGRQETFTTFDRHTDHVYCCRCGYKMEGLTNG